MNTSYYTGANLIIRRNNYFYPRTIYEGHPLIIQKNCNCSNGNGGKKKKTYKQICPLPANNSNISKEDGLDNLLLLEKEGRMGGGMEYTKYKEPISPPKKISEDFKDFYFYEKHWRPDCSSGGTGIVVGAGAVGSGSGAGGIGNNNHHNGDNGGGGGDNEDSDNSSNWGDKMSVEANIVEANGHRDLEIRLCYVK